MWRSRQLPFVEFCWRPVRRLQSLVAQGHWRRHNETTPCARDRKELPKRPLYQYFIHFISILYTPLVHVLHTCDAHCGEVSQEVGEANGPRLLWFAMVAEAIADAQEESAGPRFVKKC